ncbi:hypothetical protein X975_26976, partial [Stegodyphus mimosarum]
MCHINKIALLIHYLQIHFIKLLSHSNLICSRCVCHS